MRRKEKEVLDHQEIMEVLKRCSVINLGLHDGEYPYVITYNYGFYDGPEGLEIYFHGASEGKTPDLLRANNKVGFIIYRDYGVDIGKTVCGSTTLYESVCGVGEVEFLTEPQMIEKALRVLIRHAHDMRTDDFHAEHFKKMAVYRLKVTSYACKVATKDTAAMYQNWANRTMAGDSAAPDMPTSNQ